MFVLRDIADGDLDGLLAAAGHLDTVNLPEDRAVLGPLIELSQRSFSGAAEVFRRQYVFGLFDKSGGGERLIGTSMIHAQHGTRRAPHIFFDVIADERYSESLDKHYVHRVLRMGYNYNGPTEIGGLVLLPEYRRHGAGLGRWLSYVRFLYIALHRSNFRDEVLSELLPPLETDGTSLLWESLGRHFTGMNYQEADRISQTNKEFIRALFPSEPFYTCLLPPDAQELIGVVGPETRGVEKMLRRIGFEYANRIDPFDGGPHFIAKTDQITLVKGTRHATVSAPADPADPTDPTEISATDPAWESASYGLVCVEAPAAPHFIATGGRFRLEGETVSLHPDVRQALGVSPGGVVGVLPF